MFTAGLSGVLAGSTLALLDEPFASSAMGVSRDAVLLPELSGETWVAATFREKLTADQEPAGSEPDSITASWLDNTLITVREWVHVDSAPTWSDCAGLSPELRSWQLQFGNLSVNSDNRLLVPPSTTGVDFTAGGSSQCVPEFYSAIP